MKHKEAVSMAQRATASNPRIRATIKPVRPTRTVYRVQLELMRGGNVWRVVSVQSENELAGILDAWQEASEVA